MSRALKAIFYKIKKLSGSSGLIGILMRSASGVSIVKVFGAGLGFLSHVVLARVLSVGGYGNYIYAWSWSRVIALFSRLGFDNLLIRYIPKFSAEARWGHVGGLLRQASKYVLGVSVTITAIGGGLIYGMKDVISVGKRHALLIGLTLVPVLALMYLAQRSLRGLKSVVQAKAPELIVRHAVVIGLCGVLWWQIENPSGAHAVLVAIAATATALFVAIYWVWRALPTETWEEIPNIKTTHWLWKALPFLVISSMGLIQRKTDILMLGFFTSSADVGIYGAALRVTGFVSFGLSVANMTTTPYFSELYTKNRIKRLQRIVSLTAVGVTVFTIIVLFIIFLFGDILLGIFGTEYVDGYDVMAILAIGRGSSCITGPVAYIMMMTDQEETASRIEAGAAISNVALNGVLIPYFGAIGAAIATALTLIGRNLVFCVTVYQNLGVNTTIFNNNIRAYLKNELERA